MELWMAVIFLKELRNKQKINFGIMEYEYENVKNKWIVVEQMRFELWNDGQNFEGILEWQF